MSSRYPALSRRALRTFGAGLRSHVGSSEMSAGRGALIVLEGCDRAGKSTQVKMLVEALEKRNVPAEARAFPNRETQIGKIISSYLSKKSEISPEAVHLLFSANRWECKDEILKTLESGTTLVVDRYAASGAAYTCATTGRSLSWCKEADRGLPSPDMVILMKISEESQRSRRNWGEERFENSKLQQAVASNFEELKDDSWWSLDADDELLTIHSNILKKVLTVLDQVKDSPVGKLYESSK